MSALRSESRYDWEWNFWSELEDRGVEWATNFPEEEKSAFEREVEEMIAFSIPQDLTPLRNAHRACAWTDGLYHAIEVSAGHDSEEMDLVCVKAQMRTGIPEITRGGELISPPPVQLTFPESVLASFIDQFKLFAYRTREQFRKHYPNFLASLPRPVLRRLESELFGMSAVELLDTLERSSVTESSTPQ